MQCDVGGKDGSGDGDGHGDPNGTLANQHAVAGCIGTTTMTGARDEHSGSVCPLRRRRFRKRVARRRAPRRSQRDEPTVPPLL
jgi:hypothetical protein